jgi:hypothetical protein
MKIGELNGFEFHVPDSGGKAGKYKNKTGSVQVRLNNCVKKNIRFTVAKPASKDRAIEKAKQYARDTTNLPPKRSDTRER